MHLRNVDGAMADLNKYITKKPTDEHAYLVLGSIYATQEKYTKSIETFTKAIDLNNSFSEAYFNRGISKGLLGNHEEAIADYDKAINLKQKGEYFFNRGVSKINLNRFPDGCNDFKMALSKGFQQAKSMIETYCRNH
jgi:tetratricopeptide (TPR) repeat protein